jgi:class 3 adenylate cyclase
MATERVERRLTAILAADVVGYSRLTSMDEEGTHVQLKEHLRVLVDPKISEYRGRVVKNTGDGMLAEFGSAVDAVRCALDVQRGMVERNANVPPEKWIEFRIGINVGDIIIDRGDIFGDGVNVAARLEGLAEPGGICVSALVREYAQGKLDINFEDAGEQQLKNIAQLVRVYKLRLRDVDLSSTAPLTAPPGRHGRPRLSIVVLPFANLGGGSSVRRTGALRHQPLTHPMQRLQIQLLRGLGRHELHRRALHGFGNRFGIIEVVLLSLAIGADIFGRHQPGIVTKRCEFAAQMMCADAGFHANQARRYIGEPRFHLAPRPFLPQHDGAARIVAHDVERVLADIDADHGDCGSSCLRHGVLLVFGAPCQLRLLAGQEHGRTIPLADLDNIASS